MMRMISRLRVDQNRIGVRGQIRIGGYTRYLRRDRIHSGSIKRNRPDDEGILCWATASPAPGGEGGLFKPQRTDSIA